MCLGALAVAIIFAGLDSKGILGKAMASFNAAYGLINYFSDIMSYIRVFGLMLSSALMGQVSTNWQAWCLAVAVAVTCSRFCC